MNSMVNSIFGPFKFEKGKFKKGEESEEEGNRNN
jgi:hypothetical protein